MQQMLAAQQAMYAPLTSGGIYAGGPNAGGGLVPQSSFTPSQLMTPAALPQQATGAEKAATIANLGKTVGELGGEVGAWDWGGEEAKKSGKTPVPTAGAPAPAATPAATPKQVDTSVPTAEELIEGRKKPYAMGGSIPYGGQGLDIPTDVLAGGSNGPMAAGNLPGQQSGLDKLSKVANVADTGMKLGKFGQKIGLFSTGGTPYGGQGLDIPEGDDLDDSRQPMTAASLEKPESGLSKVGKIAQIAGTVAKVAAMFSDKRMKENIKPIGKLFDGQIVHSYNYKGDPRTQIGLIAQEVEGHKPHAVGLAGKYKTVDYAKATSGAAKRGHFAAGGMPEEEMDDVPSYEPTGLYSGDNKFIHNLFKSSASGNKNIDLMSGEEMPAKMVEEAPQESPFTMAKPVGLAGAAKDDAIVLPKTTEPKEFAKPAGLMPVPASLPKDLSAIGKLIFAAEGDGQAKTSSALGRYGIVKDTYVSYFKKAFPQQARELGDAGIKALRTTPEGRKLNLQFGPMIIADNAKHLQKNGFDTNARNVYLAHFLGPAGAVRALKAAPNTPVELAVNQESIDANPDVFAKRKIRTVGELLNWTGNTMAKRAKEMGRASGGLAGREGYLEGGDVAAPTYSKSQQEQIDFEEDQRKAAEQAALDEVIARTPIATINPTPGTSVVSSGSAAQPVKEDGLAAGSPVNMAGAVNETVPAAKNQQGLGAGSPEDMARAVAEAAPAAEKPQGLGAAAPKDNNIFKGKFFTGLKEGKATSVIPFLSGLAAMGTAPTRSLGVALSAGIGAGAQAAQAQRAFKIKQGELDVAKQLADARTMEITKGVLDGRFKILEGGMVKDTVTGEYLSVSDAAKAREVLFKMGPQAAIGSAGFDGMSAEEYAKKYPPAGSNSQKMPAIPSYRAKGGGPAETILALAEFNPGVTKAKVERQDAEAAMNQLYEKASEPGIGTERQAQLFKLHELSTQKYEKANNLWLGLIKDVAGPAIDAYKAGNQALISVNAETLVPLITAGQEAVRMKSTIEQVMPIVTRGGPLSEVLSTLGSGLKQIGVSSGLVDSILGAPDETQRQNLLVGQLKLAGMDAAAIESLRAGGSAQFEQAAVRAILNNLSARADADIAAAVEANNQFQSDPLKGNVPGKSIEAPKKSFQRSSAKRYESPPPKGMLKKGTPYYVGYSDKLYYAE
jgi:hypothetical protein